MATAVEERATAARLPEGDVIRILLEQHARIHDLFDEVARSAGARRQEAFDELRALLAVHETAEEMVLRPMTADIVADDVAKARNLEEAEATELLKSLEQTDVSDPEFDRQFALLRTAVDIHADAEEREEFPVVLEACDAETRRVLGLQVRAAEKVAPTHPHPSTAGSPAAQWFVGPFAAIADRARDAIRKATG